MLFYRFQPISKYSIQNLTLKQNWASKVSNFNDPFEFSIGGIQKMNQDGTYKTISSQQEKVRRNIISSINEYGVISYSASHKDFNPHPEHNVLMWSHYGDSHKGFCLVFDVEKVPHKIRAVHYRDSLPDLNYEEEENFLEILITKSTGWKYESEYREFNKVGNIGVPFPGELVEVIFGCRTTIQDMNFLMNLCDNLYDHKIKFSRAFMTDGSLQLTIETWTSREKGDSVPIHVTLKSDYDFASNAHL